jgi:hypothetical protein
MCDDEALLNKKEQEGTNYHVRKENNREKKEGRVKTQ